jgi:hypothetical protein
METVHGTSDGGVDRVVTLDRVGASVLVHIHPPGKPESSPARGLFPTARLSLALTDGSFPITGELPGERGQPRELASRVENGQRFLDLHLASGAGAWWVWVAEQQFREAVARLGIELPTAIEGGLREYLVGVAQRRAVTYYADIARFFDLDEIRGEGDVARISAGLGDLARSEHEAGRPLLPAAVINREFNNPGPGFFSIAQELGRHRGRDELAYWTGELNAVHEYWAKQ